MLVTWWSFRNQIRALLRECETRSSLCIFVALSWCGGLLLAIVALSDGRRDTQRLLSAVRIRTSFCSVFGFSFVRLATACWCRDCCRGSPQGSGLLKRNYRAATAGKLASVVRSSVSPGTNWIVSLRNDSEIQSNERASNLVSRHLQPNGTQREST